MKLQNRIEDGMDRARRFVKERGWGPVGSIMFHALVAMLLLGINAPTNDEEIQVGDVWLDPEANKPADPLDPTPPEPRANDPVAMAPVEPPSTFDAVSVSDLLEKPGDPLEGGVGNGTGNKGIGDGTVTDSLGFQPDFSVGPLIMRRLYVQRRIGGDGNGTGGAIRVGVGKAPASEEAVVKALQWLKEHQNEDGSWSGAGSPTAMCGLALLCYMAHGETPSSKEFGPTVEKAIRYLMYAQEPNGRFKNAGPNYVYGHAIATYALAESYGMTQMVLLKDPMEKAVQIIIDGQQAGGAFNYGFTKEGRRDLSVTGWQIQALEAAKLAGAENKGLQECLYRCIPGVKSFAGPAGGFGYDGPGASPTLAGAGILCLQLLGQGEDATVASAFRASQNMVPAWPKDGGGTYGWYYMTQAKYLKRGPTWDLWSKAVLPMLVKNQQADGHWESGSTHSACPVYDTTLCCLTLEVYYKWSSLLVRADEVRRTPGTQIESDAKLSALIAL